MSRLLALATVVLAVLAATDSLCQTSKSGTTPAKPTSSTSKGPTSAAMAPEGLKGHDTYMHVFQRTRTESWKPSHAPFPLTPVPSNVTFSDTGVALGTRRDSEFNWEAGLSFVRNVRRSGARADLDLSLPTKFGDEPEGVKLSMVGGVAMGVQWLGIEGSRTYGVNLRPYLDVKARFAFRKDAEIELSLGSFADFAYHKFDGIEHSNEKSFEGWKFAAAIYVADDLYFGVDFALGQHSAYGIKLGVAF